VKSQLKGPIRPVPEEGFEPTTGRILGLLTLASTGGDLRNELSVAVRSDPVGTPRCNPLMYPLCTDAWGR